jgi:small-conductance mechanosensitive channel
MGAIMDFDKDRFIGELQHGGPHVHFIAFILFEILGVVIFHWGFKFLIKFLAKITHSRVNTWRSTFKFMDVLLGLLAGFKLTEKFVNVPPFITDLLNKHFHGLVVFTVTFFCAHLCSSLIKSRLSRSESESSSMSILTTVIDLAVYMAGFVVLLNSYGISISPLLTALGAGGLASALALQDTLANLFSGITTIVSHQVRMGDYISLATGQAGRVVDMNWRKTTIRTSTGNMIIVPNKNIASSVITNYEQPQAECTMLIPLTITYDNDLQHVEEVTVRVAQDILERSKYGVKGFQPAVRYEKMGDYGISFNVVLRIKNIIDEPKLKHQFIKAIFNEYKKENIKILIRTT